MAVPGLEQASAQLRRIAAEAAKLAAHYGSRSPEALAEALGVQILHQELRQADALLYQAGPRQIWLLLDAAQPEQRHPYLIAHELGHLLLHQGNYFFLRNHTWVVLDKYEKEADLFAACLLIDEDPEEGEALHQFAQRKQLPEALARLYFAEKFAG